MGTIAQAVSTSVAGATNSPNSEPAAQQTASAPADVAPVRTQDTVNITETGSRNVAVGVPGTKGTAFQVAYFPASASPDARLHDSNATHAAQAAVSPASRIAGLSSTSQSANAAVQAITNKSVAGTSTAGATSRAPSSPSLSAASQAKLQQLNQVLQRLGINPNQISFADRLSLLPLVNDPQAIQQAISGISAQSNVLNPVTAEPPSSATAAQQNSATTSLASISEAAMNSNSPSSASVAATSSTASAVQTGPSGSVPVEAAHSSARPTERNGQNVNISV
jgi:hypothetical protein